LGRDRFVAAVSPLLDFREAARDPRCRGDNAVLDTSAANTVGVW
jgi:hypothetical protein